MAQASQLDRVTIAEASIAEYDDKLARLRPMLQEKLGGKKIVFGVQTPTGFLVHQRNLRISVALDAGLDVLFRDDDNAENSFELSFEQLDTLAPADVIIAQARDQEALDAIKTQPTWQRLPAVQAGNVLTSDARYNQGFCAHRGHLPRRSRGSGRANHCWAVIQATLRAWSSSCATCSNQAP